MKEADNIVKVISFTGAKDPDEYILKKGPESFRALLTEARESVEYQLMRLRQRYDIYDLSQKISFLTEAAGVLAEIESEVAREAYIKRIAAETDISVESIKAEVAKLVYYKNKKEVRRELYNEAVPERISSDVTELSRGQSTATYKTERTLLNLMFYHHKAWELARDAVDPMWLTSELHRQLFQQILTYRASEQEPQATEFLTSLSDETLKKTAASILYSSFDGDSMLAMREAAAKLETEYLKNRAAKLAGEGKVKEANEIYRKIKERRG